MKRILLSLFVLSMFGMSMAQEVKTYSVYDTNQSGDVTVSDVSEVVDQVKKNVAAASTQQYVTADELKTLFSSILDKLSSVESRLSAIEAKVGIETPEAPQDPDDPQDPPTHEYVDLGLSVKWATCNVGANAPEEYGLYFAWGETTGYTSDTSDGHSFDWENYKWCNGTYDSMTKYCTSSSFGTIDNKTTLELEDDAAHVNWGDDWRIPTYAELTELRTNCTWTWTTQNGVNGYKVTSKINGNFIFIPAAGYRSNSDLRLVGSNGNYWSSSLDEHSSHLAWRRSFNSNNSSNFYRYCGLSVRPVCP